MITERSVTLIGFVFPNLGVEGIDTKEAVHGERNSLTKTTTSNCKLREIVLLQFCRGSIESIYLSNDVLCIQETNELKEQLQL